MSVGKAEKKMSKTLHSNLLGLLLLAFLGAPMAAPASCQDKQKGQTAFNIDQIINAIRAALTEAQDNNPPGFPPLKSVNITLATVASKEGRAGFKFLVFSVGGTASRGNASTLKVTMQPPRTKTGAQAVKSVDYKQALAAALNLAKEAVESANRAGEPKLNTTDIEIEIKFTVSTDGKGGISLLPIGLDVGGTVSNSEVNTLTLVFGAGS